MCDVSIGYQSIDKFKLASVFCNKNLQVNMQKLYS